MFTMADSEEAKSGILTIKDFEEGTVSQMLHFLYTSDLSQDGVPMLINLLLIVRLICFTQTRFPRKSTSISSYGRFVF